MNKITITGQTGADYDAAIVALANHRATYPTARVTPTHAQAQLAVETVFIRHGERGLETWLPGGQAHETWAQQQIDRLWPELRPPADQAAA